MRTKTSTIGWQRVLGSLALFVLAGTATGNNIKVTNVSLVSAEPAGTVDVQFNVAWDNSWRVAWTEEGGANVTGAFLPVENWDAAWVFIKWRANDGTWKHATLAATGHTAPAGTTITVGHTPGRTPGTGVGAFIYRSDADSGSFSQTVKLRWNRTADGAGSLLDVSVHAIEMVYVAQGAFAIGSGGTEAGHFHQAEGTSQPFIVASGNAITVGTANGNLDYDNAGCWANGDRTGPIPAAFPNGYNAFYCMKYEITQGQYADFLNMLTLEQATARNPGASTRRYTISGAHPTFAASAPDRACNWLSWIDGAAYADWAGLRPMTELEYEKACRGPLNPVANEFAWGSASEVPATGFVNDGTSIEAASPATANTVGAAAQMEGPIRAGAFATGSGGRVASGGSYWGIMELSGNVWEKPVSVSNVAGRSFTGLHGNGELDASGAANVDFWPGINGNSTDGTANGLYGGTVGVTDAAGSCWRGGGWPGGPSDGYVSSRLAASVTYALRDDSTGWRSVRMAP